MAEVTKELVYGLLKAVQRDIAQISQAARRQSLALNALRTRFVALHADTSTIYTILSRHDQRLERIERRLELADAPSIAP